MITSRQFSAGLKQFGRHREFCTEMVQYALHHAMLHGQKTPWNQLHAVVPRGLKAAMGKEAPELDKKATAESVAEKAAAVVAKFWETKEAARKDGAGEGTRNASPRRGKTTPPAAPEELSGSPMDEAVTGNTIDGEAVEVIELSMPSGTCVLIGLDEVPLELTVDEYEAALRAVMEMRMAGRMLKAA